MKKPYLLNYAQCKLNLEEYYQAIEHLTTVLKRDPGQYSLISLPLLLCLNGHHTPVSIKYDPSYKATSLIKPDFK